jgi:NAD(P)-dependent dehydrogenase (short-subunit alcohol dehydrogenase family)
MMRETQQTLIGSHPEAAVETVVGDAGSEEQGRAMVDAVVKRFGRIDILVGAPGIFDAVRFPDLDADAWRRTLSATLDAQLYPAVAAVRQMRETGGGRLVLISSIDTDVSEPEVAAYNAAKAAVGALVRSIVVDCSSDGIQANAVAPGWVYTRMSSAFIDQAEPGALERINPLGRAADPDELANVIEYLALDAPPFLTGSRIVVDGGQTIRAAMP